MSEWSWSKPQPLLLATCVPQLRFANVLYKLLSMMSVDEVSRTYPSEGRAKASSKPPLFQDVAPLAHLSP